MTRYLTLSQAGGTLMLPTGDETAYHQTAAGIKMPATESEAGSPLAR